MGKTESVAKQRRRRRNVQATVLATVGLAGTLAVVMIAPNVFQMLPRIAGDKYKLGYRARTAAGRLAKKGLLRFVKRNGVRCAELTEKGARILALEKAKISHKEGYRRRWDGRYRFVMFDVPQYRRGTRDRLRRLMREFGFLRLQNSVWVYPYDCEELVALVKADLRIGKDVLYAVVESIENDEWVKKHFGLS
ncbi:MAG: CRISPR-associated endonuclease Cas2 [bacterium]|nr:CRISPR-associated endonuclease Cas2 [bacterium]